MKNWSRGWMLACAVTMTTIFCVDLLLPLGVAGGVPYVVVILMSMWISSSTFTISLAGACTGLTLLGLLLSPEGGTFWMVLVNRFLALLVIWATTFLVLQRRQTEQRHLELEIRLQQEKLESLSVLAGGIAHDFNNILVGVLGYADLALEYVVDNAPVSESIKAIQKSAERAAELANLMLAYSGKGNFVVQPVNLSDLVKEIVHLLEVSISENVALKYECEEDLPAVNADSTQIRQVVMNLIINASEALGDTRGAVSVRVGSMVCDKAYLQESYWNEDFSEGPYVYIEVLDTGCGMDEETVNKMFDPFFTTKFTGRGLGLAATSGIVRAHMGVLKVSSELGRGTSIRMLLPASELPVNAADEESQGLPPSDLYDKGTVLVVDDQEVVREVNKRILEAAGFNVLLAADGQEGVELLQSHRDEILVVLLDLSMPNMSGEETYEELKRIRGDLPVLFYSGYHEEELASRFTDEGLAGFIQKPYRGADLIAKLHEVAQQPV